MPRTRSTPAAVRRGVLVSLLALAAVPSTAGAVSSTASETITGGSLSFINSTPGAVTFPGTTLNGTDQAVTKTQLLDIADARGTGAGWNVTATSTLFTNGAQTLPAGSTTVQSVPTVGCDSGVTCILPTNAITYPYTLPAGATAPTATKLYSAATSTGTGALTITPTWRLAVPATAAAGTYSSTWTFSLVSGP